MAFTASTKKYFHNFEAADGNTYSWEIRERTYAAGSPVELIAFTKGHIKTRWMRGGEDEYDPVVGSETSISFYDDSGGNVLSDLFSGGSDFHKDFAIAITLGGNVLWIGYMEPPELDIAEDGPSIITLRATDGLGRLKDFPYVSDDGTGEPESGRERLTTIISELLSKIEFGTGFYTSSNFYPRHSTTQLTSDNDPLYNTYVDKGVFSVADNAGAKGGTPISRLDALRAILTRFALRIYLDGGKWHIYQVSQFYSATSFSRWEYDSSGSPVGGAEPLNKSTLSHSYAPATESIERSPGRIGQITAWSGVSISYEHDLVKVLQQPGFDPPNQDDPFGRLEGRSGPSVWIKGNANVKLTHGNTEDNFGMLIPAVNFAWEGASGAAITTAIGTNTATQTSKSTFETGDQFVLLFEHLVRSLVSFGATNYDPLFTVAIQVKLNSGTPRYVFAKTDGTGSWTTTVRWMLFQGSMATLDEVFSKSTVLDALPADGTLTVTLGPVLEETVRTDSGGSASLVTKDVVWDNVDLQILKADGEFKPQRTITTNFLSGRDETRIKGISVIMGDGPENAALGSLTHSTTLSDRTSDWKLGPITGAASGDSIDNLQTRSMLTNMSRARRLHSASYFGTGQRLSAPVTIRRGGSNYVPLDVEYDWRDVVTSGKWYRASQQGFTDDLVTGIDSGPGSSVFSGSGRGTVFAQFMNGLSQSFFSESSKRLTRTTEGIPAGNATADVDVEAIAEPLLQSGDTIVIIAPNLSFHRVKIKADQAAGATNLQFEDPDNPGSNFNFPTGVDSGANIFFVEDELLTVVRIGEQGFKVTVLGTAAGIVDGAQSGTLTQLTVKDWITSVDSAETVRLEDGTTLTLTANLRPGDTTVFFSSTPLTVPDNTEFVSNTQGNLSVEKGRIDLSIESLGEQLGVVSSDTTGTTVNTSALSSKLNKDDFVFITNKTTGLVLRREVAADAAASAISFTITGSATIFSGDIIVPGQLSGLRIDADGIEFAGKFIKNDTFDGTIDSTGDITAPGTAGWAITKLGDAVFNDVVIRGEVIATSGSLSNLSISGTLTMGAGEINVNSGDVVIDSSGITLASGSSSPVGSSDPTVLSAGVLEFYSYNETAGGAHKESRLVLSGDTVDVLGILSDGSIRLSAVGAGTGGKDPMYISASGDMTITTTGIVTDILTIDYGLINFSIPGGGKSVMKNNGNALLDAGDVGSSILAFDTEVQALADLANASGVLTNNGAGVLSWGAGGGGSGDVVGPASATNNAVVRFDTATGKLIQNSSFIVNDSGAVTSGTWQGSSIATAYVDSFATLISAAIDTTGTPADKHLLYYDGASPGWGSVHLTDVVADITLPATQLSGIVASARISGSYTGITGVGTITSGTWQGSVIASAYLDSDTMHLNVVQTVTAAKTFTGAIDVDVLIVKYATASSSGVTTVDSPRLKFIGSAYISEPIDYDVEQYMEMRAADGKADMVWDDGTVTFKMDFDTPRFLVDNAVVLLENAITETFNLSESNNPGGGASTEFHTRSVTITKGRVTALGAWSLWEDIIIV